MLGGQKLPDLQTKDLSLLWLDLDQIEASALDDQQLSEHERQRSARFVTPLLRHRYKAAHLFMRDRLAKACNTQPEKLNFTENAWGKPGLINHPGLHFNLSHSKNLALLGICTVGPIGVDIEVMQQWPDEDLLSLGQSILTAAEQQALQAIIDRSKTADTDKLNASQAFLTAWTRKESCVKALGLGLSYDVRGLEAGLAPVSAPITAPANGESILAAQDLQVHSLLGPQAGPQAAVISVALIETPD